MRYPLMPSKGFEVGGYLMVGTQPCKCVIHIVLEEAYMNKDIHLSMSNYALQQLLAKEALREEEEKKSSRKEARQALVVKRLNKRILRPTLGVTKY